MKKKCLTTVLIGMMLLSLAACGGEESSSNENGASSGGAVLQASADDSGNYVVNGSFEDNLEELENWEITYNETEEVDLYTRESDCYEGIQCMHFWSGETEVNFTAEQTLSGLDEGTYTLTGHIQGEPAGDADTEIYFYAVIDGETYTIDTTLDGYQVWNTAELAGLVISDDEITIGVSVKAPVGAWGTVDDITLVKE